MLLDRSNRSLKVTVATAISTVPLTATAEYRDRLREAFTPVMVLTSLPVGDTEIVSHPANNTAREIAELHIFNGDNATHDITVFILEDAVKYFMKFSAALVVGKTLHYNLYSGWAVV